MSGPIDGFVMWVVGGAASALAAVGVPVGKIVKDNRERSKRNQRQLRGDPEDPNSEGVLDIAYETRENLDRLESNFQQFRDEANYDHAEVMRRLNDIQQTQGD